MPFTLDSIQDLDAVMQRRTAAAESASASHPCQRLIAYGPDPDHTLDFYPAQSLDGPSPLVLFIHGGFWRSMREYAKFAPITFTAHRLARMRRAKRFAFCIVILESNARSGVTKSSRTREP